MLELHDIQGTILRRNRLPCGAYLFLRLDDAAQGRRWLRQVIDPVTSVSEWEAATRATLGVAFTAAGLAALGLPASVLATFSEEFRLGMAARAGELGDVGESGPAHWDGGLGTPAVHALLILHARDQVALAEQRAWHLGLLQGLPGVSVCYEQPVAVLPTGREHFGYRDGISEPAIEGSGNAPVPGEGQALKAGEIILGYPDGVGDLPPAPRPDILGRNGSYLVLRKLHQRVAEFRAFLDRHAATPEAQELLAAKLVGRWRSGAPLVLAPDKDDPQLGEDPQRNNDFLYRELDPKGLRCPLGAHIRRVNPRDALDGELVMTQRHRFVRRGLPYGSVLPPGAPDDRAERGVVFLFIGASIRRQFEFIQRVWVNDGDFVGLDRDMDPIVGANDGTGAMVIQARLRRRISGIPRFVLVRGGEYFFLPGIRALGWLAAAPSGRAERPPRPAAAAGDAGAASITDPGGPAAGTAGSSAR